MVSVVKKYEIEVVLECDNCGDEEKFDVTSWLADGTPSILGEELPFHIETCFVKEL